MQNNEGASPAQETSANTCPSLILDKVTGCEGRTKPTICVGQPATALWCRPTAEGVGETLQSSITVLTADQLAALSDSDLTRYIAQVSTRMEAAHRSWITDGCFDAKGLRDRLWSAEQGALREQWKRPHLVAQREAEIEARIAAEVGFVETR